MGTYDRQKATATRLIAKYGQSVTWQEPRANGGTAAKPASTVLTSYTGVKMVFLSPKLQIFDLFKTMIRGTEVPTGGVLALMAVQVFTPTAKGIVIRGDETLHVVDDNGIDQLAPNGELILWKIRLQR